MKIHKVIQLLLQLYFTLFSVEAFAVFGSSCPTAPLPSFGGDNYLKEYTVYGHIISNIDMTVITDGCKAEDKQFKFCVKNKNITTKVCKEFTFNVNDSRTIGDLNSNKDLAFEDNELLNKIVLTVKVLPGNLMCLTMQTSRGEMAVACKRTNMLPDIAPPDEPCRNIGSSCYTDNTKSQSLFNFSGTAVDCVKETLDKVFFRYNSCAPGTSNASVTGLNPFSRFQEALKVTIRVALILYVMLFAVNMILTQENKDLDKIAIFVIKMVIVAYFSVGIGPLYFQHGKETRANGMTEYGLPFLSNLTPYFADIVFNSAGSKGLCQFDRDKYKKGYHFYSIWDAIDCRIGYYLGLNLVNNTSPIFSTLSGSTTGSIGSRINIPNPSLKTDVGDFVKNSATTFKFFMVMFGFLASGNIIVLASGLAFCIIFLSIMLYFLSNYLVCLVTIYAMAYISPIFIPMALFTRTKAYFDAWLKVCISCTLQPAVIAGFIAILVTLYDTAIYKNCEFVRHNYTYQDRDFSTFEIGLPTSNPEECKTSAGYKLLYYYAGYGWEQHLLILFQIFSLRDTMSLYLELIGVFVFSVIFYFFSKSIGQLAAELTGGPIMDAVTASPTAIVDLAKKAMEYAQAAGEGSSGKPPEKNPLENEGKGRKGGEQASDSAGGGGDGGAGDMISGGSSGGGGSAGGGMGGS
ncbi:MAG: type IV secretion system protein [Rickettsia endosymbiont of Bryobia graminum]|nr:type IV secretion system protein [Rickettsia endosymbiont of Bryobia graminum]